MRIGNDFILFTKRDHNLTCLMLSRTFLDRERIDTIIVPMPVWNTDNKRPIYDDKGGKKKVKIKFVSMISVLD